MTTKKTIPNLQKLKSKQVPIVATTAYDFTFARLADLANIDLVLVGDSLSSVIQGHDVVLYTTLDEMIYHCRCVARGLTQALLVADLPFMSYQVSPKQALISAGRLVQEGHAEAVKLEGGSTICPQIEKIVSAGIPVVGHLGLTPQSYHAFGGHKVQGKTKKNAEKILQDAQAIEQSGACMIVLEGIPADLANKITTTVTIPTIGIGAGSACDGQILVIHDLLGFTVNNSTPKFVKAYSNLASIGHTALTEYANEVKSRTFPTKEHSYSASTAKNSSSASLTMEKSS
jgi:3-methyl-2-oxobutanoate hydroxymethyltransferase